MPTPAVSRLQSRYRVVTAKEPNQPTVDYLKQITVDQRYRPKSVSNPIRADGTRSPGYWDNSWQQADSVNGFIDYQYRNQDYHTQVTGCVVSDLPYAIPHPSDFSAYMAKTRQKALAESTEKSMQLNAFLAQAGSTGKMVGDAARTFAKGLDNLMQGPKGLFRRFGRMANWRKTPDSYLEYLYGWRPLGEDVSNAFDQLNNFRNRGMGYEMRLKASDQDRDVLTYLGSSVSHGNGAWADKVRWQCNREIITKAGYTFVLPDWFTQQTPTIAPYSTLWELTPYSFVGDWVIPIGNWIGAMESAQFAPHYKWGYETLMIRDTWSIVGFDTRASSSTFWITSGKSDAYVRSGCMKRTAVMSYPWDHLPPPTLTKLPGLQQGAQGLALLTQAFKRWH